MSHDPLSEKTNFRNVADGYPGLDGGGVIAAARLPLVANGAGHQAGLIAGPDLDPADPENPPGELPFWSDGTFRRSQVLPAGQFFSAAGLRNDYGGSYFGPAHCDYLIRYQMIITDPSIDMGSGTGTLALRFTWYEQDGVTLRAVQVAMDAGVLGNRLEGEFIVPWPYNSNVGLTTVYSNPAESWPEHTIWITITPLVPL